MCGGARGFQVVAKIAELNSAKQLAVENDRLEEAIEIRGNIKYALCP